MTIEAWGQTDIGLKRDTNQDSYLVDKDLGLFIVADGMGGHKGGEVASSIAVQTVRELVANSISSGEGANPRELLSRAYREANKRIFMEADEKPALKGMGTTMVCILAKQDTLYVANVGDSRAYLFREGALWQLTEDHSLISEQLRAGFLKEKDIDSFGSKNIITRSVGFEPDVSCDIVERKAYKDEVLIICSDGLTGLVKDSKISEIISKNAPSIAVKSLIEEAKANGGDDNITIVMLRVAMPG